MGIGLVRAGGGDAPPALVMFGGTCSVPPRGAPPGAHDRTGTGPASSPRSPRFWTPERQRRAASVLPRLPLVARSDATRRHALSDCRRSPFGPRRNSVLYRLVIWQVSLTVTNDRTTNGLGVRPDNCSLAHSSDSQEGSATRTRRGWGPPCRAGSSNQRCRSR